MPAHVLAVCKSTLIVLTLPPAVLCAQPPATPEQAAERICRQENDLLKILRGHHPIAETYVQELRPDSDLGSVPINDQYFLGKIDLSHGVTVDSFIPEQKYKLRLPFFHRIFSVTLLPKGFAQMMVVDGEGFSTANYNFEFVRREFLGQVRTVVFNVTPKKNSGPGRFIGRIWAEDRDYNIVRFNGTYGPAPKSTFYLHFDSWRVNTGPDLWVPAAIYVEESSLSYAMGMKSASFKAQTRFWGYEANQNNPGSVFASLFVDSPNVVDHSSQNLDASPLEAFRSWQEEAEANVVSRLEKAALLSPPGDVDKILETVVNNLIVTNNLDLHGDVHCRVLLTSPLESFTVGRTIIVSRGLLDTLPDEPSLAAILAHELAHIALGHKLDTRFSFNDRLAFDDTQTLKNLIFARPEKEEQEADAKAVQLLANSPYKDKLSSPGLFLRALNLRAPAIPNLTRPLFGGGLADQKVVTRLNALLDSAPQLQMTRLDQVAALPLGARISMDPWSDRLRMMHSRTIPLLSPREKLQFEVAPVYINLTREHDSQQPAATTQRQSSAVSDAGGTGSQN